MKEPSWNIVNAELRANENPRNFEIPSKSERELRESGDLVKLIFEQKNINLANAESEGERIWVKIVNVDEGRYTGILDNDPEIIKDLKAGDEIVFSPMNIVDIWEDQ